MTSKEPFSACEECWSIHFIQAVFSNLIHTPPDPLQNEILVVKTQFCFVWEVVDFLILLCSCKVQT